ncbi:hypothetical protein [Phytoactinopolyspora limicola]|uniref:hypothetical protein n=1 Tax=Phytoactinopolyspora limicola TaxID=2715536 RepID=UPI00140A4E53|nr:hypothetical protein [Phytoactinopolyspora limicola]
MSLATRTAASRRTRLAPILGIVCVAAVALNLGMKALEDNLGRDPAAGAEPATGGWRDWLEWIAGDTTEAQFYKVAAAGVAMIALAAVAHVLARRGSRWRGFDISYGSGLWPWVFAAATGGLLLSNLIWGWSLSGGDWQPTFVPFVSVPPALVLIYGPGWRVAATAATLGALLTTPVSLVVVNHICIPLDLPGVIGNVTGMWAGALIAFAIARYLPWMPSLTRTDERQKSSDPGEQAGTDAGTDPGTDAAREDAEPESRPNTEAVPAAPTAVPRSWLPRRALADFTEAQFYGNEWASAGLLVAILAAWMVNVLGPAYGTGVFPDLLTAQILAAAFGVWFHADRWAEHGWYPTFVPVVSLAPAAVIDLGGGWGVVILAALGGALVGPPLARTIALRLPGDFHPFIGSVMSMTVITLIGVPLLRLLDSAGLV